MDEILDEKTYETRKVQNADFVLRTAAFFIDLILWGMFEYGVNYVLGLSISIITLLEQYWWQCILIVSLYFIYFDGSESNATLGKQIMNIRLLTEEKRDVDFITSAKHYVLSVFLFFGYFAMLSNKNKQTLADKICKVIVIKVK